MVEKRICPICGKVAEFNTRKRLYCSEECSKKANAQYSYEYVKAWRADKKSRSKRITKNTATLNEILVAAEKEGLSYGQYVAKYDLFF